MDFAAMTRVGRDGVLAAVVALGVGVGGGTGGGSGGTSPTGPCNVDVKNVKAEFSCQMGVICGGGGVSFGSSAGAIISGGADTTPCCLVGTYIPPHDELIKGDRRVLGTTELAGYLITRKCDPPVRFLGFTFGSWTCELESQVEQGKYFQYTLGPCDDSPKGDPPPPDPTK